MKVSDELRISKKLKKPYEIFFSISWYVVSQSVKRSKRTKEIEIKKFKELKEATVKTVVKEP